LEKYAVRIALATSAFVALLFAGGAAHLK